MKRRKGGKGRERKEGGRGKQRNKDTCDDSELGTVVGPLVHIISDNYR